GVAGVRLVVTLQFSNPIDDHFQYFFLIRNAGDPSDQNYPIPIVAPPYSNGFATGHLNDKLSPTYTAGFTDFVEYSRAQIVVDPSGYTVYHLRGGIKGDPNLLDQFAVRGPPDSVQDPANGTVLRFELALSRLTTDTSNGELDPSNGTNR